MRYMVYDVAAENSGALSVLKEYYNYAKNDYNNHYFFIVSRAELQETENITILSYPKIKRSWIHRLFFDYFIAHKLVKNLKIDEILSLQNIIIPRTKVKQTVYMHNILPFCDYKFSFFKHNKLWVYQNIIGHFIKSSLKKADKVIVQGHWIKQKILKDLNIKQDKIEVEQPKLNILIKNKYIEDESSCRTFFYPASAMFYKNHKVIIEAALLLKNQGIQNYTIYLTILGNENKGVKKLKSIVEKNQLPIVFLGSINREQVFEYYSKSVLIFPSFIETIGLPLLEAKMCNTPIIASDTLFCREVLTGYTTKFFKYNSATELYCLIKDSINSSIIGKDVYLERL